MIFTSRVCVSINLPVLIPMLEFQRDLVEIVVISPRSRLSPR